MLSFSFGLFLYQAGLAMPGKIFLLHFFPAAPVLEENHNSKVLLIQKTNRTSSVQSPFYLDYLKKKQADGVRNISATTVANELKLNEVQVRKDLASVSVTGGKPKTGYVAEELIRDLESFLGYDNTKEAVIAGAGKLGQALLSYKEFDRYGLNIVAAFDTDESIIDSKRILPADKMADICSRLKVHIGIICVPPECAQSVCDKMVASGILAIWNFAPVHLSVPTGVIVQYENLAASLAVLSQNLEFEIKDGNKF